MREINCVHEEDYMAPDGPLNPDLPEEPHKDLLMGHVDWKAFAIEALHLVDEQLKKYGLEVLIYDYGDDSFNWRIVPREEA